MEIYYALPEYHTLRAGDSVEILIMSKFTHMEVKSVIMVTKRSEGEV